MPGACRQSSEIRIPALPSHQIIVISPHGLTSSAEIPLFAQSMDFKPGVSEKSRLQSRLFRQSKKVNTGKFCKSSFSRLLAAQSTRLRFRRPSTTSSSSLFPAQHKVLSSAFRLTSSRTRFPPADWLQYKDCNPVKYSIPSSDRISLSSKSSDTTFLISPTVSTPSPLRSYVRRQNAPNASSPNTATVSSVMAGGFTFSFEQDTPSNNPSIQNREIFFMGGKL